MLPKSWDDVFYLTMKELRQRDDVPDLSVQQVEKVHKLFWKQVKETMRDESQAVTIHKLLRFVPKPDANGNDEKERQVLYDESSAT